MFMRIIQSGIAAFCIALASLASAADSPRVQKLGAENANPSDQFGHDVAADGSYAAAVSWRRAVIFRHDANQWVLDAELATEDPKAAGLILNSISLSGDCCIVGALPSRKSVATDGAAYVFRRNVNRWILEDKLIPPKGPEQTGFGCSVSIRGDSCIVGAGSDSTMAERAGAAYVFRRIDQHWRQEAKLTIPDAGMYALVGFSVGVDSEYCVLGASQTDDELKAGKTAAVYVFHHEADKWTEQSRLVVPLRDAGTGHVVAIRGDRVIVGGYGGTNGGAAAIFRRDGEKWTLDSLLEGIPGMPAPYGAVVSIHDEYAAIGTPTCIYQRSGDKWNLVRFKMPPPEGNYDWAVSICASHCAVGAPSDGTFGEQAGALYILNPPLNEIPAPLTADEIKGMTAKKAMAALANVSAAIQLYVGDNKVLKERLMAEWKLIRQRLVELKSQEPAKEP